MNIEEDPQENDLLLFVNTSAIIVTLETNEVRASKGFELWIRLGALFVVHILNVHPPLQCINAKCTKQALHIRLQSRSGSRDVRTRLLSSSL